MKNSNLQEILDLVENYVENNKNKKWKAGEDWVSYSGPTFTSDEYKAAIEVLLDGWLIYGENARNFELQFAAHMGKKNGILTKI